MNMEKLEGKTCLKPLIGSVVGSFAYRTIKDRLPEILAKTIDHLCRLKQTVTADYKEEGEEELKAIIGALSRLRSRIMTNKSIDYLKGPRDDVADWNRSLDALNKSIGSEATHFDVPWLYVECHMYRSIQDAIDCSVHLKDLDPFGEQKRVALLKSLPASVILFRYVQDVKSRKCSNFELKHCIQEFTKACLWGNKFDLSISAGNENTQEHDPLEQLDTLQPYLLHDDSASLASWLSQRSKPANIHIVLDNMGFELVTDLVLAYFLQSKSLCHGVVFHCKQIPWFVSDVTPSDWSWTLDQLEANTDIKPVVEEMRSFLSTGIWSLRSHPFWTSASPFVEMEKNAKDLYSQLREADLVIFKGDLNYRKLFGDLTWPVSTDFTHALRGFVPSSLLALRTLKCDLAVGLKTEVAQEAAARHENWMESGDYGVIQATFK